MKKTFGIILLAALFLLLGCSGKNNKTGKIVIKAGYGTSGGPIHEGMLEFKRIIEESNKNIEVQLFPGGQLGSEGEIIGQLQSGLTDILPTTTGPLGLNNPVFYVLETPYIFINEDEADRVLDGPVGEKFLKSLEDKGLVGLAFWENGFREMSDNIRPIKKPADMKGIKFRTQQNNLHIKYFSDLGANPTPLPFTEIYNALATKIVDGQENPLSLISANKFYEQQKYVSKTDHVYSAVPVFFSKQKWDALPEDVRRLVKNTIYDLRIWQRQRGRDLQNEYIDEIKTKSNVYILSDSEKSEFQKAAEPVFNWAKKEYGSVYENTLNEVLQYIKN